MCARFFSGFYKSEAGHRTLFLDLAKRHAEPKEVKERFAALCAFEAELLSQAEIRPVMHA